MMERKSIMIIHPDEQARRKMHSILSHFDFQLTYANDGLHGIYGAKEVSPDLLITCIDIAVLDGLDMVSMLRNEKTTQHIKTIFLHSELNLDYIRTARNLEASAFLIKPYLDNTLIYAIKKALGESDLSVNKQRRALTYDECKTQHLAEIGYA